MPRDGALTLSDLPRSYLVCGACVRRWRYAVAQLIAAHGRRQAPRSPGETRQLPVGSRVRRPRSLPGAFRPFGSARANLAAGRKMSRRQQPESGPAAEIADCPKAMNCEHL
jgi:hypothetical protein